MSHHRFAGAHSLSGERHDKETLRRWFERLGPVMPNLHLKVNNIWVKGWPWHTTVFVQWDGTATLLNGDASYFNHGLHVITLRWAKVLIPSPYNALYASTKHAIEGYSESLDHELRTFGIRVALVEAGFTRTSFEENLTKPDRSLAAYDSVRAGMEVHMRNGVQAGDAPEVVAEAVVKAATAAVPRRRYAAGRLARQVRMMRRFVPEAAFDKSLRKHNSLPV